MGYFLWVVFMFMLLGAWITHIIVCLTTGLWGFLIAGALFVPVGIIHGVGIWLGVF